MRWRFTHDIWISFICEYVKLKQVHRYLSDIQIATTCWIQVYDHKSVHIINKYYFHNKLFIGLKSNAKTIENDQTTNRMVIPKKAKDWNMHTNPSKERASIQLYSVLMATTSELRVKQYKTLICSWNAASRSIHCRIIHLYPYGALCVCVWLFACICVHFRVDETIAKYVEKRRLTMAIRQRVNVFRCIRDAFLISDAYLFFAQLNFVSFGWLKWTYYKKMRIHWFATTWRNCSSLNELQLLIYCKFDANFRFSFLWALHLMTVIFQQKKLTSKWLIFRISQHNKTLSLFA